MTLTIDLTPAEEARLRAAARQQGIDAEECVRRLIADLPARAREDSTLELFAQWEAEDSTDDPAEIAARIREWEEFRDNTNAARRQAGARVLYP